KLLQINTGASVRFLKDRALRTSQNEGNFFSRNPDLEYRPQDDRDWFRNLSNALKDAAALCRRLNSELTTRVSANLFATSADCRNKSPAEYAIQNFAFWPFLGRNHWGFFTLSGVMLFWIPESRFAARRFNVAIHCWAAFQFCSAVFNAII